MFKTLGDDLNAVLDRDPAARSKFEIMLVYPGLHALWAHRAAHWMWKHNLKLLGRIVSQLARWLTGIEIHPGATIGKGFFIDHGMGVVIGETAEVGNNVTLYHGVTLGGTSLEKGKRHPTLHDDVVVGAGAKILGAIEIGANSRIGANAVVVKPVPANSVVVGVPGQVVARSKPQQEHVPDLNHSQLPDTIGASLVAVMTRLERLERQVSDHAVHPVLELAGVGESGGNNGGNGNGNGNGKSNGGKVPHMPDHGVWRGEDFQI
jgi:serine O-acetyltransferase